jgi:hypothetical protein
MRRPGANRGDLGEPLNSCIIAELPTDDAAFWAVHRPTVTFGVNRSLSPYCGAAKSAGLPAITTRQ